jgi:hypothetical protein
MAQIKSNGTNGAAGYFDRVKKQSEQPPNKTVSAT